MAKIKTGGPAFPQHFLRQEERSEQGMTLRDYFAIHAPREELMGYRVDRNGNGVGEVDARYAYADAMLRARGGDRD